MERIRKGTLSLMKYTDNILSLFSEATPEQISSYKNWYRQANTFAQGLANKYNKPLFIVVGVLSVLSPGVKWEQNKKDCRAFLRLLSEDRDVFIHRYATYQKNVLKALKITQAKNAEEVRGLILGKRKEALKTEAFYMNILYPKCPDYITIDRHSYRIAHNDLQSGETTRIRIRKYRKVAEAYKKAGEIVGLPGTELQAVVWCIFILKYVNNVVEYPF